MSYRFETFGADELEQANAALRGLGRDSVTMEGAAGEIVAHLYEGFQTETGEPACALVRCFKTHALGKLPEDLREAAMASMREVKAADGTPCLTLLATRGAKAEWNSRASSQGHKAIPLASTAVLARAPMIARLVEQMGLAPEHMVETEPDHRLAMEPVTLRVFHVEEAVGSEFVPIQTGFVVPMGIESVLGFGGLLADGDLYCVLMFSRVRIGAEVAERFREIGHEVKMVLGEFVGREIFAA